MRGFIALLLLSACCALGQGFGNSLPFVSRNPTVASGPEGALPSGIGYHWKASSLSSSPVDSWTDSVSGVSLTNSGAARPTWDATGVIFNGTSQYLVPNAQVQMLCTSPASDTFLIVQSYSAVDGYRCTLSSQQGATVMYVYTDTEQWWNLNHGKFGAVTTGVTYDFLYAGMDGLNGITYTNGVLALSGSGKVPEGTYLRRVGMNNDSFPWYAATTIKELIVWTNVLGFTSVQASNIHWYCTNAYSYSP